MSARIVARTCIVISVVTLIAVCGHAVPFARGQANPAAPPSETVQLPRDWQLSRGTMGPMFTDLAISPDGKTLVFGASPDGSVEKSVLHVRPIDGPDATVLPGTTGECMPTFSPDGQWVAFWAKPRIQKIPVKGGTPVPLIELGSIPYGLTWTEDGRIVFGTENEGLSYVPASGGNATALTTIDAATESSHRLPHVVLGRNLLLFTSMTCPICNSTRVESLSLDTGKRTILVENAADGRYLATGHLLFVRKGTLAVVPFDVGRMQVTGPATVVLPGVLQALNVASAQMNSGAAQYGVSESGTLIWAPGGVYPDRPSEIFWVDRSGRAEPWTGFAGRSIGAVRVSRPDGTRVAANANGFDRALLVYDARQKRVRTVTPDGAGGWPFAPWWTPDGRRLVFGWQRVRGPEVWEVAADGTGKPERLVAESVGVPVGGFTPDGRYLALVQQGDVKVLRMADRQVIPFAATKAAENFPDFSPDSRWLAYASNESGRNEVYVRSFPDGKRTLQVSADGGTAPVWAPDGRELFYWDIAFAKLMRVAITPGPNLAAGRPAVLFEFPCVQSGFLRTYDITPDGRRFLILKRRPVEPVRVTEFQIARNWLATVRQIAQPPR